MKIRQTIAASAIALAAMGATSANAGVSFMPYQISAGDTVNQFWPGSLGMDFTVNAPIVVTSFGAWEPNGIPAGATLTASIYNQTTQAVVYSQNFTSVAPGTPGAANVGFISVNDYLAPGNYALVGDGFGIGNYNTYGTGLAGTLDTGNGLLTFGSWSYANAANVYPNITYANSGCCDGASDFRYADVTFTATAVPEPATWAMLLLGFFGIGFLVRSACRRDAGVVA
jgi:hypothetical protein